MYVYTLTATGEPREHIGKVQKRCDSFDIIVFAENGQRICVPKKPQTIHHNIMWSSVPMMNLYIERMIEILLNRQDGYRQRIDATQKRINKLKGSWTR